MTCMIQHSDLLVRQNKDPIRKAHFVGTSVVITIDPNHVRRLGIDERTFFIERPIDGGIILEMYKIDDRFRHNDNKRGNREHGGEADGTNTGDLHNVRHDKEGLKPHLSEN